MARLAITENELLDALAAGTIIAPKEALTTKQMAERWKISREKVEEAIGRLAMMDRIEVHKVQMPDISGRKSWRPAYTILPKQQR